MERSSVRPFISAVKGRLPAASALLPDAGNISGCNGSFGCSQGPRPLGSQALPLLDEGVLTCYIEMQPLRAGEFVSDQCVAVGPLGVSQKKRDVATDL